MGVTAMISVSYYALNTGPHVIHVWCYSKEKGGYWLLRLPSISSSAPSARRAVMGYPKHVG